MNEAQRDVALFRYSLIREAADESLTIRQRGQLVRELAAREHVGPKDRRVRVGRGTIDRWIRAYRVGGFEALAPEARTGEPVTGLPWVWWRLPRFDVRGTGWSRLGSVCTIWGIAVKPGNAVIADSQSGSGRSCQTAPVLSLWRSQR